MPPTPTHNPLEQALDLARLGMAIFPVYGIDAEGRCTCGTPKCQHPGKHPASEHGFKDASRDPEIVRGWEWAGRNIGIATGAPSGGLVVIDIDPRHGGDDTLSVLEREHGSLGETVQVKTGGGGLHIYYRHPAPLRSGPNRLGDGIDLKAEGGYVVAPGSRHASGGLYEWEIMHHAGDVKIAPLPGWVVQKLAAPDSKQALPSTGGATFEAGERNTRLASLAGSLRTRGLLPEEILATLRAVNRRCQPRLEDEELQGIAHSYGKYEAGALPEASEAERQAWYQLRPLLADLAKQPEPDMAKVGALEVALERLKEVEAEARPLPLVTAAEMAARAGEAPEYLVDGLIREGTVNLLLGGPGEGKTYLAQALGTEITKGGSFLGKGCTKRPVVYVNGDNPDSLLAERQQLLGCPDGLQYWPLAADPPLLGAPVYERLVTPERPLLVFDVLRRFFKGDENSSSDTGLPMGALRRLAAKGCTILLLHHSSKAEGASDYRGSSEIMGAVDFALRLKKADGGQLDLRCCKNRFGLDDWTIPLRLEVTPSSARFIDLSEEREAEMAAEREEKLEALRDVIADLERELGRGPNQSRVIERAKGPLDLGEKAIAALLAKGEGRLWRVAGLKPKTYSAIAQLYIPVRNCGIENTPGNGGDAPEEETPQPTPWRMTL